MVFILNVEVNVFKDEKRYDSVKLKFVKYGVKFGQFKILT